MNVNLVAQLHEASRRGIDGPSQIELLVSMTGGGKEIVPYEKEVGEIACYWLCHSHRLPAPLLRRFFAWFRSLLKSSMSLMSDETVESWLRSLCDEGKWLESSPAECRFELLTTLDHVVRFGFVRDARRFASMVCKCLCAQLHVEQSQDDVAGDGDKVVARRPIDSWSLMRNVLSSGVLGEHGMRALFNVLETDRRDATLCAAVFFVGMSMWGSKRVPSLERHVSTSAVLTVIGDVLERSVPLPLTRYEIALALRRLARRFYALLLPCQIDTLAQLVALLADDDADARRLDICRDICRAMLSGGGAAAGEGATAPPSMRPGDAYLMPLVERLRMHREPAALRLLAKRWCSPSVYTIDECMRLLSANYSPTLARHLYRRYHPLHAAHIERVVEAKMQQQEEEHSGGDGSDEHEARERAKLVKVMVERTRDADVLRAMLARCDDVSYLVARVSDAVDMTLVLERLVEVDLRALLRFDDVDVWLKALESDRARRLLIECAERCLVADAELIGALLSYASLFPRDEQQTICRHLIACRSYAALAYAVFEMSAALRCELADGGGGGGGDDSATVAANDDAFLRQSEVPSWFLLALIEHMPHRHLTSLFPLLVDSLLSRSRQNEHTDELIFRALYLLLESPPDARKRALLYRQLKVRLKSSLAPPDFFFLRQLHRSSQGKSEKSGAAAAVADSAYDGGDEHEDVAEPSTKEKERLRIQRIVDRISKHEVEKVGLVYVRSAAETSEDNVWAIERGSPRYERFARTLGALRRVADRRLLFVGGLDRSADAVDGTYARICQQSPLLQTVWLSTTLMPAGQSMKKRHIGNCNTVVVYLDSGQDDDEVNEQRQFDPFSLFPGQFTKVYIVVRPHRQNSWQCRLNKVRIYQSDRSASSSQMNSLPLISDHNLGSIVKLLVSIIESKATPIQARNRYQRFHYLSSSSSSSTSSSSSASASLNSSLTPSSSSASTTKRSRATSHLVSVAKKATRSRTSPALSNK
jgi:Rap/ran-GAP